MVGKNTGYVQLLVIGWVILSITITGIGIAHPPSSGQDVDGWSVQNTTTENEENTTTESEDSNSGSVSNAQWAGPGQRLSLSNNDFHYIGRCEGTDDHTIEECDEFVSYSSDVEDNAQHIYYFNASKGEAVTITAQGTMNIEEDRGDTLLIQLVNASTNTQVLFTPIKSPKTASIIIPETGTYSLMVTSSGLNVNYSVTVGNQTESIVPQSAKDHTKGRHTDSKSNS